MKVSAVQIIYQQSLIARRNELQNRLIQNNMTYLGFLRTLPNNLEQVNAMDTQLLIDNLMIQYQLKIIDEQLKSMKSSIDYKA